MLNSSIADEAGFADVGFLFREYEAFHQVALGSNEERFIRNFFNLGPDTQLVIVDIVGNKNAKVAYARCYLWNLDHFDMEEINSKCHPSLILGDYSWYVECIPQILGRQLYYTSFNECKTITELDYQVGFRMNEYYRMGIA